MKIYIDPRSTFNYSSYYIKGMYDYFGKNKIHFSSKYFKDLKNIDILMAFVLVENGRVRRFIIDYRDQNDLIEEAYQWTDVYAKINVNATIPQPEKVVCIPPSFAINIWNKFELLFRFFENFIKAGIIMRFNDKNIHLTPKRWAQNFLSMRKRQKLESYTSPHEEEDNYVFFISTLWQGSVDTNSHRYRFMHACMQNPNVRFDGGFFVASGTEVPSDIPKKLICNDLVPNTLYLENIKKSAFVFNTPAVHHCHGWKLGEFLAMGKVIISTPLSNRLPAPLEDGKHICIVNNEEEIGVLISKLLLDKELIKYLKENVRAYYEKYASPRKVIESIMTHHPKLSGQ